MIRSFFKRKINNFFLYFFISISSLIQLNTAEKHFLWEIKSNKATVYLLGSIHVAKENIYPLDSIIENAFEKSDYLVVEVDLKNLDKAKAQELSLYNDGTTLEDHLSKETYAKLKNKFKEYKIHPAFYKKMKPWAALSLLLNAELKDYGYKNALGIDAYFLNKSKMKTILELESFEKQINIFDVELKTVIDDFIDYSIKDIDNSAKMLDSMFVLWSIGDAERLKTLVIDDLIADNKNSTIIEVLFTKRNKNMAQKIEEYLDMEGKFFVIAGAGHLIGENGILDILIKKNKYLIKQL
jgi:uncharacterized protein YbaP (TraB family)